MSSSILADEAPVFSGVAVKSRWIGRLWALWLALFPVANFLLRQPPIRTTIDFDQFRDPGPKLATALVSIALAGVGPTLVSALVLGVDFRRATYLFVAVFVLLLSIPLSFLALSDPQALIYVVLVYNVVGCSIIAVSANVDEAAMFPALFSTLAIAHGLMLAEVFKDHDFSWGRLFGRDTPAYWGMVAQTAIIACVAMRGWVLRAGIVAISLLILYYTQSRGSMMATAVGLGVAFVIYASTSRWRAWLWIGAAVGAVFIGLLGSGFIAEDLFKVSDPARGAGSGLTGRASAWNETMTLITNNPWVGVGYRQHEHYLTTEASAHNAYLATLADTGVIGFFGYMLFLVGGLSRAIVKAVARPTGSTLACAGFLAAFLFNGMVERTALNTGNAYCQLMILLAAWAWRLDNPDAAPKAG